MGGRGPRRRVGGWGRELVAPEAGARACSGLEGAEARRDSGTFGTFGVGMLATSAWRLLRPRWAGRPSGQNSRRCLLAAAEPSACGPRWFPKGPAPKPAAWERCGQRKGVRPPVRGATPGTGLHAPAGSRTPRAAPSWASGSFLRPPWEASSHAQLLRAPQLGPGTPSAVLERPPILAATQPCLIITGLRPGVAC